MYFGEIYDKAILYFLRILAIMGSVEKAIHKDKYAAGDMPSKGEMEMVKEIQLTPYEVRHFVNVASRCDFEIDISYNRYIVDAKSFLGVYGLDLRKSLKVSYEGYDKDFEELLKSLAIAS